MTMMNDKINSFSKKLLILIAITAVSCWDRPLFTELTTNRLEVRIMGTYSSDGSETWDISDRFAINDDSITDNIFLMDNNYPELFMFDLAEMRLSEKQSKGDKFSIYRQTFQIPLKSDNSSQDNFFNGIGVALKNDDAPQNTKYHWVRLYIRKMAFDKALRYYYDDENPNLLQAGVEEEVVFHERTVKGFDINLQQLNSKYDSLKRNNLAINRIFPFDVPIVGGLAYNNKNKKTVLEIRFHLKNYIKKYELVENDEENDPYVSHYFAFADGLRDVLPDDAIIGGNILAVARAYIPNETGTIDSGSITSGGGGYVIAIPAGENISDYIVTGSYRKTFVTKSEEPALPFGQTKTIASTMNYYLKSENYKYRWNYFMENIRNGNSDDNGAQLFFENEWDAFDNPNTGAAKDFKMPPLATRVYNDVPFSFENVSSGEYDVYRIYWTGGEYGVLPDSYERLGSVTVESGKANIVE